jgi:hypothetical protein
MSYKLKFVFKIFAQRSTQTFNETTIPTDSQGMTEVAYGQFYEALEDAVLPLAESNEQEQVPTKGKDWTEKYEIVRNFFRAMETVNNPQLEGCDSSANLTEISRPVSDLSPGNIFAAIQAATLNDFGSTDSLTSYDAAIPTNGGMKRVMPEAIEGVLHLVDEFMHNHDNTEDIARSPVPPAARTGKTHNVANR